MENKRIFDNLDLAITDLLLEGCLVLQKVQDPLNEGLDDFKILYLNKSAEAILDISSEFAIGNLISSIVTKLGGAWSRMEDAWFKLPNSNLYEYHLPQLNRIFIFQVLPVEEEEIIVFFVEITSPQRAETAERLHKVLFENAQDIILYMLETGRIIDANQKACTTYGYTKEELCQLKIQDLRHHSTMSDYEHQMRLATLEGIVFESIHQKSDGTLFPVEVSARSVETSTAVLRIHIIRDISKRKEQEAKIAWLASHDGLTGVLNRSSLLTKLREEIERAERSGSSLAVFLFDIDKFKEVNDIYGHEAGDLVLKRVASNVRSTLRGIDHLGRLGGDEFVVLMVDVKKQADISNLVERLLKAARTPVEYNDESLQIALSLGISQFPQDATGAEELLNFADQAMYRTKRNGGNNYLFYCSKKIENR